MKVERIDEKYCINDLVQLMPYTGYNQLIIDADEIVLLKNGRNVVVNKYVNHPSRDLFPFSKCASHSDDIGGYHNELFEYDKIYLNFINTNIGIRIRIYKFFKDNNCTLFCDESLSLDERTLSDNVLELSRNETEDIFNSDNYDSMYIVDKSGSILYASNKKDGIVIDRNLIPSIQEIVKMDKEDRESLYKLARMSMGNYENLNKVHQFKSIDDINNLKVYGPVLSFLSKYAHFLITSKDGKFDVKLFKLDYLEKDKFRLTTASVPVLEPTLDDVTLYAINNDIQSTCEPNIDEMFEGEAISNIGEVTSEIKVNIEKPKQKIKKQVFFSRFLKDSSSK